MIAMNSRHNEILASLELEPLFLLFVFFLRRQLM